MGASSLTQNLLKRAMNWLGNWGLRTQLPDEPALRDRTMKTMPIDPNSIHDVPMRIEQVYGDNCAGVSDVGRVRSSNEDAFFADPHAGLFVVADGMGGHVAGELASAIAVETVRESLSKTGALTQNVIDARLHGAFADAEKAIEDHAATHPECAGMGTTLIVGLLRGNSLTLAHAGDVRGYLLHTGTLTRLTNDHTAIGHLLRSGLITEEEARHNPNRNQVHEAVGGGNHAVASEITRLPLMIGDVLMLCSDGFWDELAHEAIAATLARDGTPLDLATALVDQACDAGGQDNVTVLVYRHDAKKTPLGSSN